MPLTERARESLDTIVRVHPTIGDGFLFPAPKKAEKPWSRWHARDLLERAEKAGIDVPIVPGILPILSTAQIRRFTALCGAKIPAALDRQLDKFAEDDNAVRELGIEHATEQVRELWDQGVPGVHFYVLNRSYSVSNILDNLKLPGHTKEA